MEKWTSKKWLKALPLAAMCLALAGLGGTYAYYSDSQGLSNPFTTGKSKVSMEEDFNPDSSFLPGETVTKRLYFRNTGSMDLLLRVEVPPTESWVTDEDDLLETKYVIKNWNESWGSEPEDGEWADAQEWTAQIGGYRYYKKILKAGESTNPILDSISMSTEVSNDRHEADYSNQTYHIKFEAQAIPVSEAQALEDWGVTAVINESSGNVTWETR